MNVLIVSAGNLQLGGVAIFLLNWIEADKDRKYNFTWYFRGKVKSNKLYQKLEDNGVKIIAGNNFSYPHVLREQKTRKDLREIIAEGHFNIIHTNTGSRFVQFFTMQEAVHAGIPVRIAHSHSSMIPKSILLKGLYTVMGKYIYTHATCCAACSTEAGKTLFGKNVISSPKWKLIQNTIDTKKYAFNEQIRKEYRNKLSASSKVIMGCVGNSDDNKNHILALRVVKKLKDLYGEDILLLLIGEDKLKGKLKKEAKELGVTNNVSFMGTCGCVENWLQAMDIFLMPSKSEGAPIAAIEAQASGLPCILSDRISREIKVGHAVEFASINKMDDWLYAAKKYIQIEGYDRKRESEFSCKERIDISLIPKYMEMLYGTV